MALGLYCSEFLKKLEDHEYKIDNAYKIIIDKRDEFILKLSLCIINKGTINLEKFYYQGQKIKDALKEIYNKKKLLYSSFVKEYTKLSIKTGSQIEKEMFIHLSYEYNNKFKDTLSYIDYELTYNFDEKYLKKNNYDVSKFNKKEKILLFNSNNFC